MRKNIPDSENENQSEPWFVPALPEAPDWDLPLPRAPRAVLPDPGAWARAEAGQGRALAEAAAATARLDERLRRGPPGGGHRLAVEEAEALARASGDRWPTGALALHDLARPLGPSRATPRLESALWALRRLRAGQGPAPGALAAFLGLHARPGSEETAEMIQRPGGASFAALAARWEDGVERAGICHPLTRAAFAFHLWQVLGLSPPGDVIEAGVAAALIGAADHRGGAGFVTLGRAGPAALLASVAPPDRLAAWLRSVRDGAYASLIRLDRLDSWSDRAARVTADLTGRTPPRLIAALAEAPVLSAAAAAAAVGCSRDAAERNLALLSDRGLAREVTGQRRFRFWRAAL